MKRYIARLQEEKTPHERRQYALRVATGLTAILFVGWVATLGMRLSQSARVTSEQLQNTASSIIAVQEASTTLGY
jgi:hypothetical protein